MSFLKKLQEIISQGYEIAVAEYFTSNNGNSYGSVGYYDPNDMIGESKTLDMLANPTSLSSDDGLNTAASIVVITGITLDSYDQLEMEAERAELITGEGSALPKTGAIGKIAGYGLIVASGVLTVMNAETKYGHLRPLIKQI